MVFYLCVMCRFRLFVMFYVSPVHLNCSVSETRWKSATKRLMRVDSSSPLDTRPKTPKPKIAWLLARSLFIRQIRTYCRGDRTRRACRCRRATYNVLFLFVGCDSNRTTAQNNNTTKQKGTRRETGGRRPIVMVTSADGPA